MAKGVTSTDLTASGYVARAIGSLGRAVTQSGLWMQSWMGPGAPMVAMAPTNPEAQVVGRRFQYPVGYNQTVTPRVNEAFSFKQLRYLADACDVLRAVIETRKDQLQRLKWQITPRDGSKAKPDDARIAEAEAFFRNPCTEGNWQWWLRMIAEDMFVVDGITIYKRRTVGGKLYSLDIMAPDTIKVLLDGTGRRPQAPEPAYQQIIFGVPASDYLAVGGVVEDNEGKVPFTTNELIYRIRNPRTNRVYGFSGVEQIAMTLNIAIRRQIMQLSFYTAGNIPDMLLAAPLDWTPEQIQTYQEWWDAMLSDDLADRRKLKMVPGGSKPILTNAEVQKDEGFDEWLARVICFVFSISPTPFVKMMNRATSDTSKESADEEGLQPIKEYLKGMIDEIVREEWGDDLEFGWKDSASTDKVADMTASTGYANSGILTIDEVRAELGMDGFGGLASRPTIKTANGVVPVQTDVDDQGNTVVPTAAEVAAEAGAVAATEAAQNPPENEGGQNGGNPPNSPGKTPAKTDKLAPPPTAQKKTLMHPLPGLGFMGDGHNVNAVGALTPAITTALQATGKAVAAQVVALLNKADETDEDKANRIAAELDLGGLAAIGTAVGDADIQIFRIAATNSLLAVGTPHDGDMFNQVNDASVEWAGTRSAELVTEIDETTRAWIRSQVADSLAESTGAAALARKIEDGRSFTAARAKLIAETEIGNANGAGALEGLRLAAANGVTLQKQWLVADLPCPICEANAEVGPIPIEQPFPSGDAYPLAHPRCRCTVIGVVQAEA